MSRLDMWRDFLAERAEGDLVPWSVQAEAMRHFQLPCPATEEAILEAGFLPIRYRRNREMISTQQQLTLFRSQVAVVGCGGLGGYLLEELARVGVGRLVAIDPDTFEEHNLNRQLLSTQATLGRSKTAVARDRIAQINPAVTVRAVEKRFVSGSADALLGGANVVADGLDTIETRLELAASCSELGVPLVHGTIAGWFGYVTTVFPGDDTLQRLYGRHFGDRGIEVDLGNPAFTPAVVASLQVAEIVKVLLRVGTPLRRRVLCVNLLDMDVESIPMVESPTSA